MGIREVLWAGFMLSSDDFGDGGFLRVQTPAVGRENHALSHSDTVGVTTGQESRSGRGAGGRTDVEVGQLHPLFGHPVEVRGGVIREGGGSYTKYYH